MAHADYEEDARTMTDPGDTQHVEVLPLRPRHLDMPAHGTLDYYYQMFCTYASHGLLKAVIYEDRIFMCATIGMHPSNQQLRCKVDAYAAIETADFTRYSAFEKHDLLLYMAGVFDMFAQAYGPSRIFRKHI